VTRVLRNKNFYLIFFSDAVLVTAAYCLSYLLRFDGDMTASQWLTIRETLPYIISIKLICFFLFGLYRGIWRYTSLSDIRNVFIASAVSSAIIILAILYLYRFQHFSRSVFAIDWVLTFLFVGGLRTIIRIIFSYHPLDQWHAGHQENHPLKKLLIIGAGDAGEKVLREIQETSWSKYEPVGFLDDDRDKQGKTIHGVPVLGTIQRIKKVGVNFDEILIAIPSVRGEKMRRVVACCSATGKPYRTVPGMLELIEGKVSVKTTRRVHIEDLLNRDEVHLDEEKIRGYIGNQRILITGAGGSIGSELVRQVCRISPQAVALVEFSEKNLYQIEMECKQNFGSVATGGFLVDIKNRESVNKVFRDFSPDVVFHAAAYKHVPMQEIHPWQATSNNIMGTKNVVDASIRNNVKRFVLVSTDKAVRPTNVMGATKRVAEMFVEGMNGDTNTRFMAVRFGNVLWSSGSAIPLFQKQIARGGPVTVTHPKINRFFMSIPEAAQLILQAGSMGTGGEIFILNMGKPMRIVDLARDLIRLNGLEPEKDIPIEFIGLRPGEKLYEELITEGEGIVETDHEKIMVLHGNSFNRKALESEIEELLSISNTYDTASIKKKLHDIVPEYTPQQ
jgi:FlaA1/EpsC-like NDP-sugar epimerase